MRNFKFFIGYVPYFNLYSNNTEVFRINSTGSVLIGGNVGTGTNIPSARLNIQTR
jgi:hypothetical protein